MPNNNRWRVHLGEENWSRYTYSRPEGTALRLLGSVARGAQVGALAETAEGRFVQVNGDHIAPLSEAQVRRAVAAASRTPQRPQDARRHAHATSEPAAVVRVTVKKRRVVARPGL